MRQWLSLVFLAVVTVEVRAFRLDAGSVPGRQKDDAIVVSAAISLTHALQEVGAAYHTGGGGRVTFNFAASNVLARQIMNGAPVDVFISADTAQMDLAERAGAIDRQTRRDILSNRLVIVTPSAPAVAMTNAQGLLDRRIRRIAIGDPAGVPAGVYAKSYLQVDGLWDAVQSKLVPLASVRAALEAAESASVDAAIVYESDAAAAKKVQLAYVFPRTGRPPIIYPAVITARSKNPAAARRFLDFLQGPEALRIFERYKFTTETRRAQSSFSKNLCGALCGALCLCGEPSPVAAR